MKRKQRFTPPLVKSRASCLPRSKITRGAGFTCLKEKANNFPQVQILDLSRLGKKGKGIISSALENEIYNVLNKSGKVLLFMNRKGFSTHLHCQSCGFVLKCDRCNTGLVYHFDKKILLCPFCQYKIEPASICPNCQSSYIRYSGTGVEKLESEIHRIFPQAKIAVWKRETNIFDFDIFIATQLIMKESLGYFFDLVSMLQPESSLNRVDFRAAEKTFSQAYRLAKFSKEKFIIQTKNPSHYSLQSIYRKQPQYFYRQEIKFRKELDFPPFRHFIQIILRGKVADRVKSESIVLFDKLNSMNRMKDIDIFNPLPANPSKLRGNFYWNILIKTKSVEKANLLIKEAIKKHKKSGSIITVNVDL